MIIYVRRDYTGTVHAAREDEASPSGVPTLCGGFVPGFVAKVERNLFEVPPRLFCGQCQWTREIREVRP